MSNPPGYPSNAPDYPSVPSGYPNVPSGYPGVPPGYPSVPSGYPQGPAYLPTGDLRTYVAVLRRRKWSVVLGLVLVCGLIALYTVRQTPTYDSTAEVLVKPLSPNQILQGVNYNFLVSMQTEEALVSSPAVADAAAEIVKARDASGPEPGSVSTTVPDQTTFLDITYTAGDGASAQLWANAYAQAYVANRKAQAAAAYQTIQTSYQEELTKLEARFRNTQKSLSAASGEEAKTFRRTLQSVNQQITSLQAQLANVPVPSTDSAQVLAPGGLPSSPSSPNYVRNGALAIVLGLGLGIGIAFVRERLDERITSREDLEGLLGASVLAVIPKVPHWRKRTVVKLVARDRPKSAPAEAYRAVRTNVDFLARTNDLKVIALTSPSIGEGKTTTTANLALTMAQTGKRVIAVSCDLRKPRLHRFFGLSNSKGLTDLLTVGTPLNEIVQRSGAETLRIVPSGPIPPNPAELLGSDAMGRFFEDIRHAADYVLIDTAPVIAVSDATILAPQCDGVIVVVDATSTSRTAVTVLRAQLERVGARILGGIYNNFDPRHSKSYPGYYRYYSYGYKSRKKSDEIISGNGKPGKPAADPADAANIWH